MIAFMSLKEIRLSKYNVNDTVVYKLGYVYWSCNHVFFSSMRSVLVRIFLISRYVPRKLCTESAVPEEATQHWKVSGQESNGVFSVILSALNPSSLRRISPSPSL